jgi:uncharacterized protein YneR
MTLIGDGHKPKGAEMFQKELDFFKQNQAELYEKYGGKVLVIKDSKVLGVYEDPMQAYDAAKQDNEPGTFMIQPCDEGPEAYTVTISTVGLLGKAKS